MAKTEISHDSFAPVCRQCGKTIEGYTDEWAYRRVMKLAGKKKHQRYTFCSWKCLCQAEREADAYHGVKPDKYETAYQRKRERDRQRWRRRAAERKGAQEGG